MIRIRMHIHDRYAVRRIGGTYNKVRLPTDAGPMPAKIQIRDGEEVHEEEREDHP